MKKVLWLLLAAVLALGVAACGDDLDESNDSGSSGVRASRATRRRQARRSPSGRRTSRRTSCSPRSTRGALEAKDFEVSKKLNIGSREAIFPALEQGEITVLPEYTRRAAVLPDRGEVRREGDRRAGRGRSRRSCRPS